MMSMLTRAPLIFAALALFLPGAAQAGDWPQWRYDASRAAASPHSLPQGLKLAWTRDLPVLKAAWPDQPKMQLDTVYEPVVLGKRMFVASSRHDSVTAYDTANGSELWRFFADGPIRMAPLAWEDRVFFASDDGHLYCVQAERGELLWKFRGGPSDRRVLGNLRLISTWPARGGPVLADGTLYFAAGIWPFMGTFIHSIDPLTGKALWTNDGDGSIYMKQPHSADSFAGVAPQGPLVVAGDKLLIPGGRSVPACFDRHTGKMLYYQLNDNGKRGGGSQVSAIGNVIINGGAAFDLSNEKFLGIFGEPAVLSPDVLFSSADGKCVAYDPKSSGTTYSATVVQGGIKQNTPHWSPERLGGLDSGPLTALIKAGDRLIAAGPVEEAIPVVKDSKKSKDKSKDKEAKDATPPARQPVTPARSQVAAYLLPLAEEAEAPAWETEVEGTVASLLAADDRLFAVTREGRIYCFAAGAVPTPVKHPLPKPAASDTSATGASNARDILTAAGVREGYAVVWGAGDGSTSLELARQSKLHVIAVEENAEKVRTFREQLVAENLSGEQVSMLEENPAAASLPQYLASLLVVESFPSGLEQAELSALVTRMYSVLRPYGGVACLTIAEKDRPALEDAVRTASLPGAKLRSAGQYVLLSREGALPGSANWTHEHADAANTRVSKDKLVKAPLGILWFGGVSHEGVLPRHGHGPQPQVIDGRLIIEGVDFIRATDIYTGRLLWETPLPDVGAFYNNTLHQPGANAGGTNHISTSDGIYVAYRDRCLRLDPATGQKLHEFKPPVTKGLKVPDWGYLNVSDQLLIGGADPLLENKIEKPKGSGDDPDPKGAVGNAAELLKTAVKKIVGGENDNFSSSRVLFALDRHTGKTVWTVTAESGFRHNAIVIGGGKLFAIDRLSGPQVAKLKRRGETPAIPTKLIAFDLATGQRLWERNEEIFGTWLSYSAEHDLLVEAGRVSRDTLNDEPKGMRVWKAASGTIVWQNRTYLGPAMIHGDTIIKDKGACELLSGAPVMREDPFTGQLVEWTWARTYGCNTPSASEHLLTFRSGAAGYYDFCNDGGTGNFGGFRSSCTNNLIVAGGLLNAPDYTRTCSCSYQNQTSLAMVPMPDAEMWTFFGSAAPAGPVRRVGINLGAPGDRRADDGTLWVEYPSVGGTSPTVKVSVAPDKVTWYRRHSTQVAGTNAWVTSSGVRGLSSLKLNLGKSDDEDEDRTYTVRLYFAEPDDLKPGERTMDVALQGKKVLEGLDVAREAGVRKTLVKQFKGIIVREELTIGLTPGTSSPKSVPVLCGVEIVAEGW